MAPIEIAVNEQNAGRLHGAGEIELPEEPRGPGGSVSYTGDEYGEVTVKTPLGNDSYILEQPGHAGITCFSPKQSLEDQIIRIFCSLPTTVHKVEVARVEKQTPKD